MPENLVNANPQPLTAVMKKAAGAQRDRHTHPHVLSALTKQKRAALTGANKQGKCALILWIKTLPKTYKAKCVLKVKATSECYILLFASNLVNCTVTSIEKS